MSTPADSGSADGPTKAEIRSDIEEARAELADTVEALAHKLDVKGRAQARIREIPPAVPVSAAALVAVVVVVVVWRKVR